MKRHNVETVPLCSPLANKKKALSSLLEPMPANKSSGLNFQSPRELVSSILSPVCNVEKFFAEYWEKQPLHIPATSKFDSSKEDASSCSKDYYQSLFNMNVCREILTHNQLLNGVDMVLCKYVSGQRINLEKTGPIKFKELQKYFYKDKMTLQFHQPQRFHDELWKIQEMLECNFGCLVGSNIYMTPENSQGLAPHYDNVEVFIFQLEGSKEWKLYEPIDILPKECSSDLTAEEMSKTKLIKEITLNVGDVLYFPRGTIHQAKVLEGAGHSTHITISAYSNNSWQDYFQSVIPHITSNGNDAVVLRQGVPFNYHDINVRKQFKTTLSEACRALTAVIERFAETERCDECSCDFFANRLPPFAANAEPSGPMPFLDGAVRFLYPHHVILSKQKGLYEDDIPDGLDDEDSDVEDDEDDYIYLYHSLKNDRTSHMFGNPKSKPNGLKFDSSCWDSLMKLHQSSTDYISVKDLNLPEMLGLDMLVSLWSEGLVEIKET